MFRFNWHDFKRTNICATGIALRDQAKCRFCSSTDNTSHLAKKFTYPRVSGCPLQHKDVNFNMPESGLLPNDMRIFQVREFQIDVASTPSLQCQINFSHHKRRHVSRKAIYHGNLRCKRITPSSQENCELSE